MVIMFTTGNVPRPRVTISVMPPGEAIDVILPEKWTALLRSKLYEVIVHQIHVAGEAFYDGELIEKVTRESQAEKD